MNINFVQIYTTKANFSMNQDIKIKLKRDAHHLKPVILIGQKGLTDAVITETDVALKAHECIKIKISGWEKPDRQVMISELCKQLNAEFVDSIGHTSIVYRKNHASNTSKHK
jgi:RNA-binding protein